MTSLTRLIRTDDEHAVAMQELARLIERDPEPGTRPADRLEVLALHIEEYERRTYAQPAVSPMDAIKFRMEQAGLKQKDLIPIIGARNRVSEVLNGKRTLSKRMIRNLHEQLGIPLAALLAPTPLATGEGT